MSGPLEKARLEALDRQGKVTESIPVQFNPTTMSLQMSNSNDGGSTRGRQTQQYNGSASTTLSLDLEFDTADDGSDVRALTAKVARFVLPGGKASKQAPPRVLFRWGTFELKGVMVSLSEELGLFSAAGTPLRAKVGVQIKEQDSKFEALERGPGANTDNNPAAAGESAPAAPGGPGTSGGGLADTAVPALAGETPADFLARNGLAPEAWRTLGGALDALANGIELEAGLSVEFASSLSLGAGLGVSAGFQAGLGAAVDVSLGLEAEAGVGGGAAAGLQQGFALASAGGLTAAAEAGKASAAAAAADAARTSFGLGARVAGTPPAAAPEAASRQPLATSAGRTLPAAAAPPAPLPPQADPRAVSFGRGVPLRDRVTVPGAQADGYVVIGSTPAADATTASRRGRGAPWERLAPTAAGDAADRRQHARRPSCGCHRCDPLGRGGRP